jgi:hypothetical protein
MTDYKLENYWALIKDNKVMNVAVFDMPESDIQEFAKAVNADYAIHCEPHNRTPNTGETWDGENFIPETTEE